MWDILGVAKISSIFGVLEIPDILGERFILGPSLRMKKIEYPRPPLNSMLAWYYLALRFSRVSGSVLLRSPVALQFSGGGGGGVVQTTCPCPPSGSAHAPNKGDL